MVTLADLDNVVREELKKASAKDIVCLVHAHAMPPGMLRTLVRYMGDRLVELEEKNAQLMDMLEQRCDECGVGASRHPVQACEKFVPYDFEKDVARQRERNRCQATHSGRQCALHNGHEGDHRVPLSLKPDNNLTWST